MSEHEGDARSVRSDLSGEAYGAALSTRSLANFSEISERDDDASGMISDAHSEGVVLADNLSEFDLDDENDEINGGVERGLSWDEFSEEAGRRRGAANAGSPASKSVGSDGVSLKPMVGGKASDDNSQSGGINFEASLADLELEAVTLVGSDDLDRLKAINLEIIARVEPNATLKNYSTLIDAYLALSDVYVRQNDFREAYNQKILAINVKQTLAPAANNSELHYVIQQYCDIGSLARIAGDLDHSEWYFSEAYYLAMNLFGETGKEMGPILLGYGELTLEKGQIGPAVQYLERSLELLHSDPNCNQDVRMHAKYSLAKALKIQAQDALRRSDAILGMGGNLGYFPNASIGNMSSITSMHSDALKLARQQSVLNDLQGGGGRQGFGNAGPRGLMESTISSQPHEFGPQGSVVMQENSNNLSFMSQNDHQSPFDHNNFGLNEPSVATYNENESYFTEIETLPLEQDSSVYADLAFAGEIESESAEEADLIQANLLALNHQRLIREEKDASRKENARIRQQIFEEEKAAELAKRRKRILEERRKKKIEDYKYGYKMKIANNMLYYCCVPLDFGSDEDGKRITFSKVVSNSSDNDDVQSLSATIASKQSNMEKAITTSDKGIREYLCRTKDEAAYFESCNKIFVIPCFPVEKLLKRGGKYRPDVIEMAQYVVSYRVRRLVIEDEISSLQKEITATENLQEVCAMKARLIVDRMVMLEKEMTKQTTLVLPASKYDERFSYMLSTQIGWNVISTYLHRELKRLSNPLTADVASSGADASEAIDKELTIDTVRTTWTLMQEWLLVHSIVMRCKLGKDGYPVPPRPTPERPDTANEQIPREGGAEEGSGGGERSLEEEGFSDPPPQTTTMESKKAHKEGGSHHHHSHHSEKEKLNPLPHLDFECIAEWESICEFFELSSIKSEDSSTSQPDYRLLSVLKKMKERIDDNTVYFGLSNVLLSDIALGINELTEFDQESQFLGASFSQVMCYLGDLIEKEIMLSIRHYSMWGKILERMRKDRVKKANGKLIVKENGVLEIDFYGKEFMIPHAELHVDTDLVHHSMQRIFLHILTPILEKKYKIAFERQHILRGELQVLVQCVYQHAAPYIQRLCRGVLQRMKTPLVMRDLALHSMHAACLLIQSWLRSKVGRAKFQEQMAARKEQFKNKSALLIQSWMQTYAKWKIYQRYKKDQAEKSLWYAVSNFQAIIRGYNDRARLRKERNKTSEALKKEIQEWSVIAIQKLARGYIARKTVVKSMRVRKALSSQTLDIAERFLKSGDVWRFLKEIDSEMTRLNTELSDTNKREADWADSFIKQVLDKRKNDFDSAWNRFSKAVTKKPLTDGGAKLQEIGDDFLLSAVGDVDTNMISNKILSDSNRLGGSSVKGRSSTSQLVRKSQEEKERLDEENLASSFSSSAKGGKSFSSRSMMNSSGPGRTNLPGQRSMESQMSGPLLRRAVTTTIQESVKNEIERQKLAEEKNSKLIDDMKGAYSGGPMMKQNILSPIKPGKKAKKDLLGRKIVNVGQIHSTSADWVTKTVADTRGGEGGYSDDTSVRSQSSPSRDVSSPSKTGSPSRGRRRAAGDDDNRTVDKNFGELLLIDIPLGVDDTIEHIFHAAALRVYVPQFFSGITPEEAYNMYLQLPKGLARMKYEAEAWKWSQVFINRLRQKGLTRIKQLLPTTFFRNHLKSVETPPILTNKVIDLYLDLKKLGDDAFKTSENAVAKAGYKKVKEGLITLSQEVELAKEFPSGGALDGNGRKGSVDFTSAKGVSGGLIESSDRTLMTNTSNAATCDSTNSANPELPSRLLLQMVEGGAWTDLKSPMEDLLMYAAYLVIPHVPFYLDKSKKRGKPVQDDDSTVDTTISVEDEANNMGQYAFKRHINEVQNMENESDKREAIKNRFRAALIVTTPYILRLQAEGISTVFDLVKVDFERFKMPAQLQNQIESCLSVAVSLSKNAKIVPTARDHLSTSQDLFTVAMIYDPKFQRGPFDPYGKPSPLLPLRDIIKAKKIQNQKAESLKDSKGVVYPDAIWNKQTVKPDFDESSSKRMFDFNMHHITDDAGDLSGIPDSSEHEAKVMRAAIIDESREGQINHQEGPSNNQEVPSSRNGRRSREGHSRGLDRLLGDTQGGKSEAKVSFGTQDLHETSNPTTTLTKGSSILKKSSSLSNLKTSSKGQMSSSLDTSISSSSGVKPLPVKASMTASQIRKMHQDEEMKIFKKDFQQHAKEDFRRPYKCSFPGCMQAFSRHYNLKIHEKGHRMFEAYHSYKHDPQLFYDLDSAAYRDEKSIAYEASVSLPPIAQSYVNTLATQTQMSQSQIPIDEMQAQMKSRGRDIDRQWGGDRSYNSSYSPIRAISNNKNLSNVSAAKYESNNNSVAEIFGIKFGASLDLNINRDAGDEDKFGNDSANMNHTNNSLRSVRFQDEEEEGDDDDTWYKDREGNSNSRSRMKNDESIDQFSSTLEDSRYKSKTPPPSTHQLKNTIFGDDEFHEKYANNGKYYHSVSPPKPKSTSRQDSERPMTKSNDREQLLEFYNSIQSRTWTEGKSEDALLTAGGGDDLFGPNPNLTGNLSIYPYRDEATLNKRGANPFADDQKSTEIYENSMKVFLETI